MGPRNPMSLGPHSWTTIALGVGAFVVIYVMIWAALWLAAHRRS
jgi:hypothetical protein